MRGHWSHRTVQTKEAGVGYRRESRTLTQFEFECPDYDESVTPARLGRDLLQTMATLERVLELSVAASPEPALSYRAQYLALSRIYEETGQRDRAEAVRRRAYSLTDH